ncbi:DNA-binding transcriptional regulator GbsR, MarR family [Lentibacillus persicus]|uniref:HTH-type transcriptional regulator n=1 Tax=Lentibacillus persicus TaxID=640948 RepID=A0A1I1RRP5_9BACI|nr:transcriptional regulator [Lentibacillus persicus]SFD36752.1 DNA-binding transcriptional regulator GbsR, MarR family [Lentibacillus persicus]
MQNLATEDKINNIILEFSKTIELFGLNGPEARLFAYLYLQKDPKTLDEMGEAFGKSKTSINTNIRNLSNYGLVSLIWKKGVRKDLYAANEALFKTFMTHYISKWISISGQQKDALNHIKTEMELSDTEDHPDLIDSLDKIIRFHRQIETSFNQLENSEDET